MGLRCQDLTSGIIILNIWCISACAIHQPAVPFLPPWSTSTQHLLDAPTYHPLTECSCLAGGRNFGLADGGGDSCGVQRATHCQECSTISLPPAKAVGWAEQNSSHFTDEKTDAQKGPVPYQCPKLKRTGRTAQLIQYFFNMHKALGSIPSGAYTRCGGRYL